MASRLGTWFGSFVLSRLVASPRGRAFLFSFMADAEEADEGAFDRLVAKVDRPDLQKMVRTHQEDEERHARLMRECVARTGVAAEPLPAHLRIVDRIDRLTGNAFRAGFPDDPPELGVVKVYALLEAVEERGVTQFGLIARALRPHDPRSAAVIDAIVRDEERHVRYARAIARRYAPDARALEEARADARAIEARAFEDHGRAFTAYLTSAGLLGASAPERAFWRVMGAAGALAGPTPARHPRRA